MKLMKVSALIFIFTLISAGSFASDSDFVFTNNHESKLIGKHLYILTDKTNELNFTDIVFKQNEFLSSSLEVPNLGISAYTHWLKFSIRNESTEEKLLLLFSQPFLNEVILYTPNGNKGYSIQQTGDNFPFYYREHKYPNFVFNINIKPGQTQHYFMKVKSDEQILLPIKIGTSGTIISELHSIDLWVGIYIGIILAMLFYNIFVYFSVRDKIYLKYVVYIFFIGFTQACIMGYPFEIIWPNYPSFANLSIYLFTCGVGISSLEFLKPFLRTKLFAPRLHKFSYVITFLYSATALISILGFMNLAYLLILANAAIVSTYMMIVALVISKKGYKPANFFLIAWSVMLVGIFVFVLKDFGFLPTNNFTSYTMPIGSALETLLLSFALADRINILKKEKEISQAEALRVAQQNQKLITEQNIILEQKVHERTLELEDTNEELNVTLNYLKDTQSQLVNAEKMASLGQLTAGIAHEINNPINFVSANLKPLKLDISEVYEVIDKYETLTGDENTKEKIKEIEVFKKQIDLDYLKQEINTLINGIEDGAKRTTEIVLGLKNFSRLDESDIKEANINEGIESTLVILRSSVQPHTQIITELGTIPSIECFPGKLNQVFMNVFSNAIYAMNKKQSTEPNKLTIKTFEKDNKIYVTMEDTGTGMSKEAKEKIFEPFFTTKDVGEGTGLGMSIVFKIVESHHAKMEIESEEGKGTKITLILNKKLS
jgi:signal transduction histidine kinase